MSVSRKDFHQKKPSKKFMWIGIALASVVVLVGGAGAYAMWGNQPDTPEKAASSATTASTTTKTSSTKTSSTKSSSTQTAESTTTTESSSQVDESQTALVPGKNHNQAASAYAHNAGEMQQIMDGVKAYDGDRWVFLTFDDGVNEETTPKVLDKLKEAGVPATFFIVGNTVGQATKHLLEREIKEGHAIALHSFNHDYQVLYPGESANPSAIKQEAQQTETALKSVLGQDFQSNVWRYPGGHMSWYNMKSGDSALQSLGINWIDWNAMNGDAEANPPTTVQGLVDFNAKSIEMFPDHHVRVVLMHDSPAKKMTIDSIPGIVKFYKDHGFKFGVLE